MSGGSSINIPGPSPEEQALQKLQLEILQEERSQASEQLRVQNLLLPVLFGELNINPVLDESGKIIGFDKTQTPEDLKKQDVQSRLLDRTLAALKGELPVNPALLTQLDKEEQTLNETFRKSGGPDYQSGTPFQTAFDEFSRRKSDILEASRRGDLTLGEALSLSRENQSSQLVNQLFGLTTGFGQSSVPFINSLGQTAAGLQGPLNLLFQNRNAQLQANIASAQFDPMLALFNALGSAGGTAAGLFLGSKI